MTRVIAHYGILRRSGRYPWGSGGETTSASGLLGMIDRLAAKGLSEVEIAKGLGMSTKKLRNQKALAKGEIREAQRLNVIRQKKGGMSVAAIAREFRIAASTVRELLRIDANLKYRIVRRVANRLAKLIGKEGFIDVGEGVEVWMGVTRIQLENAVTLLENEGYKLQKFSQPRLNSPDKKTNMMVIGPPGSTYKELFKKKREIQVPNFFTEDGGDTFFVPDKINNMSSDRVLVKYKQDGGAEKDGLIEMRSGVPELSLGEKAYAQVRIGVDGSRFMKGMAVSKEDIPNGYDIVYNTSKDYDISKSSAENKLAVMKPQQEEGASRVGSIIRPNVYEKDGEQHLGVVNIVGDVKPSVEGSWAEWNKTIASQVLSKQAPRLANKQLDIIHKNGKAELDDIMALTDPTVRNHLLIDFADKADRAAVDLKAAALPRQTTNVVLPDPNMKADQIYAPNYNNGDSVVLVRYPHGGVFEIPRLTVNNKTSQYRDIIGTAPQDAVAIHPSVAQRLSGADFDGDTVLVIPDRKGQIRTSPSLESLKTFDPIREYPKYPGMKLMSESVKEIKMGDVSNLITDMTIKGASQSEIAQAVKHSMVVIDAVNHELNYTQSYRDNGIAALKKRYQGSARSGASTLISKASAEYRVPHRYDHYSINPKTGEKVYEATYESYIHKKTGREIPRTTKTTWMGESKDGYDLSSGTVIESVYADHANSMKSLGNQARLATLSQQPTPYNRKAIATYKTEVTSLDKKHRKAVKARPIERKAQILGEEIYKSKKDDDMSAPERKKWRGRSLVLAQARLDSAKPKIDITPREWEAIEMGAISPTRLRSILRNADMDLVRTYATPRATRASLSSGKQSRAQSLLKAGYTAIEVASAIGVPVNQIHNMNKDLKD
jgi:DNA-binding CsgD family transcriptional regulator